LCYYIPLSNSATPNLAFLNTFVMHNDMPDVLTMAKPARNPLWFVVLPAVLCLMSGLGALTVIQELPITGALSLPYPTTLRAMLMLAFTLLFAALFLGLLARWQKAYASMPWAVAAYAMGQWLFGALFAQADYDRGRLGIQALVTLFVLIPVFYLAHRKSWWRPL
jgi:hypothetical protein